MTHSTRPPFILCFAGDKQGCGHARIVIPLASLAEAGVADGRIDLAIWPDQMGAAAAPDVVIWQRQVEDAQLDAMARWRRMLPDALFIYELDDYLGKVPSASFHAGFMPPDIEPRITRALTYCDRVTTTTEPMADWLRSLGGKDVRIVPNGIPAARLKEREARRSGRLRVGFAGGISHDGDLELIRPAMAEIGEAVEWVFFGMQPKNPPVRTEFHEGVAVTTYLDKLATLDVDLMLAPLEENRFNVCKSNLRLIETGSIGASVIAQHFTPYLTEKPPVFGYATTPDDWTREIKRFIAATPTERKRNADALRAWVGRHYVLERLLRRRVEAWLPESATWRPSLPKEAIEPFVVSCSDAARMPGLLRNRRVVEGGLEEACAKARDLGAHVLWLRPGTSFDSYCLSVLQAAINMAPDIGSAMPLASDGPNAFPQMDRWFPAPESAVMAMAEITRTQLPQRRLLQTSASGPCVLLSRSALALLGTPDVAGCGGNEEQAIFEWSLRAHVREWKHVQAADAFAASVLPPPQPSQEMAARVQARGWIDPPQQSPKRAPPEMLSNEERERLELELVRREWAGPRPGTMGFTADYSGWKLLRRAYEGFSKPRFVGLADVADHEFGDTSESEWTIWHDGTLALDGDALMAFSEAINKVSPEVRVIYADHDSRAGDKLMPELKPDFDLELFLAQDYVTPLCAIRTPRGEESGTADQVQDRADLYSRVLDVALEDGARGFVHIPRTLGAFDFNTSPEQGALEALSRQVAIEQRLGDTAVVTAHKRVIGCLAVLRRWQTKWAEAPLVSIIIPTLGSGRLIQPCINTIRQHTEYPNWEVIVVQNGAQAEPDLGDVAEDPRVHVLRWDGEFNWSAINNHAIQTAARGEFLVCLNDDTCVAAKGWLDAMMGQAAQSDAGVIGARLLHPMGYVQHVGVIVHKGAAGHMHKMLPNGHPGHLGRAMLTHEASAVTGACMLFSREVFDAVGGFDMALPRNYNDTDFCLRVLATGRRNIVEMHAELLHPEGTSRGDMMSPESLRRMQEENRTLAARYPGGDRYWSPCLEMGFVNDGLGVRGLNADMLAWRETAVPREAERCLVINDRISPTCWVVRCLERGIVPMAADLSGFRLQMLSPTLPNLAAWDIRDPERMAADLRALGISRIVLGSLVGMQGAAPPVEALRCFASLGIAVVPDNQRREELTPWEVEGHAPDTRVFGIVDMAAWKAAFTALEDSRSAAPAEGAAA